MDGSSALDAYWLEFVKVLPEFSPEDQRIAVALYRELAKGTPLTTARIAGALGLSPEQTTRALARHSVRAFIYEDQGRITGFGGLAATPMHHTFRLQNRTLWTWCAWDSLFIPTILGETAEVTSPDPVTQEPVRLVVSPRKVESVSPDDAVVSFLLPEAADFDQSAANVMAKFCHFVFFFASRASAEQWQSRHPGTTLMSPQNAFELGARLTSRQFGVVLSERSDGRGQTNEGGSSDQTAPKDLSRGAL